MKHSNHKLTYIEMYPEPLNTEQPSGLKVLAGALLTVCAVYAVTVLAFSL